MSELFDFANFVTRNTPAEAKINPASVVGVRGSASQTLAISAVVGGTKNNSDVVAATLSLLIKIIKIM